MVRVFRCAPLFCLGLLLPTLACSGDSSSSNDEVGDGDGDSTGDGDGDSGDGDGEPGDGDGDGDGDGEPGDGDGDPADVLGCDGASFYEVPANPAERGPWPVGVVTVEVEGVTTEIWYPAQLDSEAALDPVTYDLRYALPPSEQDKISDEQNPLLVCDCYRDLPIDTQHGPYPVVVFIHGTASFRMQSLTQMTHWASRGFVVVSSDHLGLWLADSLALACGGGSTPQNLSGDTDKVLAALASPSSDLAFLDGLVDLERVAISGHSAGGNAAANQANKPGVRVSIPMASGQAVQSTTLLESSLLLGGLADGVVAFSSTQNGYGNSPAPKRLIGIANAGHLVFSDICEVKNDQGQDILQVATEAGVCGAQLAGFLFDCDPNFIDRTLAKEIINYSTTAVLEDVLKCVDGPDRFADFQTLYPAVDEFQQEL